MASYYSELGIKEKEDRAGGGTPGAGGRGNRWVSQAVDDFMNIGSNRPTPVAAMASPERFLNVARLYSDFMDNNEGSSGGGADMSNHQQFLESLIMQLYEEANATSAGPPPASREFIRTLPVVTKDQFKDSDVISCTICNEDVFSEETAIAAHDSVTKLPCKHHYHRECVKPWLELHNTCPMCRHEVPSDDPQWLEKKREDERRTQAEVKDIMMFG